MNTIIIIIAAVALIKFGWAVLIDGLMFIGGVLEWSREGFYVALIFGAWLVVDVLIVWFAYLALAERDVFTFLFG